MQKKYTFSLIVILCAMFLCILILLQYQAFLGRKETVEGITYVNEYLSVNYPDGQWIESKEDLKEITFSITNQSMDSLVYYIHFTNISGVDSSVTYEIRSNEEDFTTIEDNFSKTVIQNRYEIPSLNTHRYTMVIHNPNQKSYSFKIEIDKDKKDNSFSSTLLLQNEFSEDALATGLIRKEEQFGEVYYFRGNVPNNYVSFAGLTWRVVKINEDNTVKLVLNTITEEMLKLMEVQEDGISISPLKNHLEEWYQLYLGNYDSYVSSTLYCYDDSIMTDEGNHIAYLSQVRYEDGTPTNSCGGKTVSQKIALLTADEVMFAGGSSSENKEYYLYLDSLPGSWWTMTPNKREDDHTFYMAVSNQGALEKDVNETSTLFVRPVITLNKKTEVTGLGTIDNPYVVK